MKPWRVPYPKFGAGPGLVRVARVAAELGVDLGAFGRYGAVIVGSNGKGSTAAMTAALLSEAGAGVGLFTSPHLFDLNERFRIDGADISDAALHHHWTRVQRAAESALAPDDVLGGFEFLFLIAADWFAASNCRTTVWEAGIGGRLDPVRLIEARRLALTSLDLEHTELLGDTLEAIARDKLDAAPAGAVAYIGASCASEWLEIKAHCAARGVRPERVSPLRAAPLPGDHQCENAALAVALVADIEGKPVDEARLAAGFRRTRWPGRLETLSAQPLVVIDVGHTPAAVRAALAGFRALAGGHPAILVCGASEDKKVAEIVGPLAGAFPVVICAAAAHKGAAPALVAQYVRTANPAAEILVAANVAEAHACAMARARTTGAPILAAGGLFLAAEFKAAHLGRPIHTLAFF